MCSFNDSSKRNVDYGKYLKLSRSKIGSMVGVRIGQFGSLHVAQRPDTTDASR